MADWNFDCWDLASAEARASNCNYYPPPLHRTVRVECVSEKYVLELRKMGVSPALYFEHPQAVIVHGFKELDSLLSADDLAMTRDRQGRATSGPHTTEITPHVFYINDKWGRPYISFYGRRIDSDTAIVVMEANKALWTPRKDRF